MQRRIHKTKDGSDTIAIPASGITYHSVHGAITESLHVFINSGLHHCLTSTEESLHIFEMGFGTGLNALLTLQEADNFQRHIHYTALEKFPLEDTLVRELNYPVLLASDKLQELHAAEWGNETVITPHFKLLKLHGGLEEYNPRGLFNLFFFDAFAPSAQPELWTTEIFHRLLRMAAPGAVLVTYCAKGMVRRAMQQAGWLVEKLPGPPGKREMLRAHNGNIFE